MAATCPIHMQTTKPPPIEAFVRAMVIYKKQENAHTLVTRCHNEHHPAPRLIKDDENFKILSRRFERQPRTGGDGSTSETERIQFKTTHRKRNAPRPN